MGYFVEVGDEMTSKNESRKHDHNYFNALLTKKQAIFLQGMSPTKNGKVFFNNQTGSSSTPLHEDLHFKHSELLNISIKNILEEKPDGTFKVK
uniref:Uncharacterized protein n=1 Tax=Clytia hemisphaerica TaxID=252671 RepID=A0A7M5WWA0_9CNID